MNGSNSAQVRCRVRILRRWRCPQDIQCIQTQIMEEVARRVRSGGQGAGGVR